MSKLKGTVDELEESEERMNDERQRTLQMQMRQKEQGKDTFNPVKIRNANEKYGAEFMSQSAIAVAYKGMQMKLGAGHLGNAIHDFGYDKIDGKWWKASTAEREKRRGTTAEQFQNTYGMSYDQAKAYEKAAEVIHRIHFDGSPLTKEEDEELKKLLQNFFKQLENTSKLKTKDKADEAKTKTLAGTTHSNLNALNFPGSGAGKGLGQGVK
jgi:hypothetical protein